MFKTGDRTFELADADNLALASDAISTKAFATFTGSYLTVTKQAMTLTTVNPVVSTSTSTSTSSSTQTFTDSQTAADKVITNTIYDTVINEIPVIHTDTKENVKTVYQVDVATVAQRISDDGLGASGEGTDPIAQFFRIQTGDGSSGVFGTSLEIYFKQKPASNINGVTVYLCEFTNGQPDSSRILPYSQKHLDWSNITVTSDASTSTKFTFDCPVFMNNNREYAFVVKPDNNDVDYWVYSAELGDQDPYKNVQVSSIPVVGTAFYSATEKSWTALQTEYIKFKLNIGLFTKYTDLITSTKIKKDKLDSHIDFYIKNYLEKYLRTILKNHPKHLAKVTNTKSTRKEILEEKVILDNNICLITLSEENILNGKPYQ